MPTWRPDREAIPTPKYPIDVETLRKGDYIPPEELEKILQVPRSDRDFSFEALKLIDYIEKRAYALNTPMILRFEKDGIRVLTDDQAVDHTHKKHENYIKNIRRWHGKARDIDILNLTAERAKELRSNIVKEAFTVQAIKRSRRRELPHVESPTRPKLTDGSD